MIITQVEIKWIINWISAQLVKAIPCAPDCQDSLFSFKFHWLINHSTNLSGKIQIETPKNFQNVRHIDYRKRENFARSIRKSAGLIGVPIWIFPIELEICDQLIGFEENPTTLRTATIYVVMDYPCVNLLAMALSRSFRDINRLEPKKILKNSKIFNFFFVKNYSTLKFDKRRNTKLAKKWLTVSHFCATRHKHPFNFYWLDWGKTENNKKAKMKKSETKQIK